MKRYVQDVGRIRKHFSFIINRIRTDGELDLRLRGKFFNIYYRGNSLAKVMFKKEDYLVSIHNKFLGKDSGGYEDKQLEPKQVHSFFSKKKINEFCKRIKEVNYSEELMFEQMLISDNRGREDLIIVDRQVTDTGMKGRIDLLALKKAEDDKFNFIIIEVKLGNNQELQGKVVKQINGYVEYLSQPKVLEDWKNCYSKVYSQLTELGLVKKVEKFEIGNHVKGLILVARYKGLAESKIRALENNFPDVRIKHLTNLI